MDPADGLTWRVPRLLSPVMRAFERVLIDAEEQDVAAALPWREVWGAAASTAPPPTSPRMLQAFSIAFELLQLAEEISSERALHEAARSGAMEQEAGSWEQHLTRARDAGHDERSIARRLVDVRVEPVLTAHPTECKRRTVLQHHRSLHAVLCGWHEDLTEGPERARLERRLEVELERLWRTGEVLLEKPGLADEIRNVVHYLTKVFPLAIPATHERLSEAWERVGFDPRLLTEERAFPRIRIGNWVGGDRDGHPLVTTEVTADTLQLFRREALALLRGRLRGLAVSLSVARPWSEVGARLLAWREKRLAWIDTDRIDGWSRYAEEPFRQAVLLMEASLPEVGTGASGRGYGRAADLLADLALVRDELLAVGAARLVHADLDPVIRHVEVFGFHLASLDVRQNSVFHDTALEQLLQTAGESWERPFAEWPEETRVSFLRSELARSRPFAHASDESGREAEQVVSCLRVLARHHAEHGRAGLGSLIVSMTRQTSDLLCVFVLAREAGLMLRSEAGLYCPIPVVPLFETIPDLEAAPAILEELLSDEVVRRSLEHQASEADLSEPVLEVMVGYSDSGKDGGVTTSFQSLLLAQSAMASVGRRHGVRIRFFHGRGGTIGRGAGPTHRFLAALPAGALDADLRLTEQGETIEQRYGHPRTASNHLELLLAGTLGRTLRDDRGEMPPALLREALAAASGHAERAYRSLVDHEDFIPFFSQATPIDAIEQSRIGSRPARRTGRRSLEDLRAIPWVFAWSQSRFNLPGWFGLGSGLAHLESESPELHAGLVQAKREESRWPPIHYLISNAATAWAVASPEVMKAYAELVESEKVRETLLGAILLEYRVLEDQLTRFYGASPVVARPKIQHAITLRDAALAPLHARQIALLEQWRSAEEGDRETLVPELLLSINAIAAGLGSTG